MHGIRCSPAADFHTTPHHRPGDHTAQSMTCSNQINRRPTCAARLTLIDESRPDDSSHTHRTRLPETLIDTVASYLRSMEMEATGRDGGGHRPSWNCWSYRHEQARSGYYYSTTISSGGSSSGTIASAAYTSNASRMSSVSMEVAMHFDDYRIHEETDAERVKSLAHEFFHAPLVNCSIKGGGDMGVLERWLTELGVGWVLRLASGVSAWEELADEHTYDDGARSWIRALHDITQTIRSVAASLFLDRGSVGLLPSVYEEEEEDSEAEPSVLELLLFARFVQETMLKMLAFVDFVAALDPCGVPVQALHQKIHVLLRVHGALSDALTEIKVLFLSMPPSAEVERIREGVVNLLYAKNAKARESIRNTLEDIRSRIMEPMVDGAQTPHGSSDIHKVTLSVMTHITFLLKNYSPVDPIVSEAAILGKYVPHINIGYIPPLDSMIMEMASCLEERILHISETFLDQGLRFLFLLNNSNFICRSLHNNTTGFDFLEVHAASLLEKVEGYLESYLEISWTPVLSCLFNPTPLCFRKNYSLLPKFESKFQKMYTIQKLWKVPDPEMRKRLRKSITEKIILGYTKYIEDNNVTTPKSTTHNLEEMLQDMFEG